LNFVLVDVDIVPEIARTQNVPINGFYVQLPYIVFYKNGVEDSRYPQMQKNGVPYQVRCFKEKELVNMFDLELIFNETLSRNIKAGRITNK